MNKQIIIAILISAGVAGGMGYWLGGSGGTGAESDTQLSGVTQSADGEREVLFWRNPMNPAISSPVFMQDEMGMDYLPVYADEEKPQKAEREILFWRNPMNPAITSPVFMQDEMGMDYLPVYVDGGGKSDEPAGTVEIDPVLVQNIGVRTQRAERKKLSRNLHALGHVDFNEERLSRLHPKTSGWIEKLRIDETGTEVKKDTILLHIYSPELVAAQQEYLIALRNWESVKESASAAVQQNARQVMRSARERLQLFDVPEHQIRELEQSQKSKKYLHIHSPFTGTVMNIGVREGEYVTPRDEIYLIADLQSIWVYVDVYEDQLPWIKLGDSALMQVRSQPGRDYKGEIRFIYPTVDPQTRTVRVRLEFANPERQLKPGMFANITLLVDPRENAVVIPSEAIVRSGPREQVFVQTEPGKFIPREVKLGISADGETQILSGVEAGELVVTSSQFLIDSESKLREATAKMMAQMTDAQADMSDMDMDDMRMDEFDMSDMAMDDMSMDMSDMEMNENTHTEDE